MTVIPKIILGLESSCDDSAAALVTSDRQILAQAVVGQNQAHQPYGGVVPEIAARAHVEILPGLIRTPMWERAAGEIADAGDGDVEAVFAARSKGVALGRYGTADEVANLILFLCSEGASYLTGAAIDIDGGLSGGMF